MPLSLCVAIPCAAFGSLAPHACTRKKGRMCDCEASPAEQIKLTDAWRTSGETPMKNSPPSSMLASPPLPLHLCISLSLPPLSLSSSLSRSPYLTSDRLIFLSVSTSPSTRSLEGTRWLYLRFSSDTDVPECCLISEASSTSLLLTFDEKGQQQQHQSKRKQYTWGRYSLNLLLREHYIGLGARLVRRWPRTHPFVWQYWLLALSARGI